MKHSRLRKSHLETLSHKQRVTYAEHLRERIYATLTLLAVVVVLWQHPEGHSALSILGSIAGTVIALWLATLVASRMSYRIVHDTHEVAPRYREVIHEASGLLAPAGAPVLFVLISMTGLFSLKTALLASVVSLVLSLFVFSLVSGKRVASSLWQLMAYSALQMTIGLAVVLLKLAVE